MSVGQICPTCLGSGVYDPLAVLAAMNAREARFVAAYPRIYCPACRKRVSPTYDAVNANVGDDPMVNMSCPHCGERFSLPLDPSASGRSDDRG